MLHALSNDKIYMGSASGIGRQAASLYLRNSTDTA